MPIPSSQAAHEDWTSHIWPGSEKATAVPEADDDYTSGMVKNAFDTLKGPTTSSGSDGINTCLTRLDNDGIAKLSLTLVLSLILRQAMGSIAP